MSSFIATPGKAGAAGFDNVISMSNTSWARLVTIPSSWNKLRIGVRMWMTDLGSGPTSTPYFALGLCSGTTNIVGDATTTYFVGVITNASSWTYAAPGGGNAYFNINYVPCNRTGSVLSSGSANITTDARFGNTASFAQVLYVDITKGNPAYTFNIYTLIGAGLPSGITSTTFLNNMPLTTPNVNAAYSFGTAQTMSVNETLSGSLNAVNCWWNRADFNAEIQDVAVAVLQ